MLRKHCLAMVMAVAALSTGCATVKTLSTGRTDVPVVYSGTRLNLATINHNPVALKRFDTSPPRHPTADLPLSLAADTLLLGLTLPVAAYYSILY
ncbi:MAG: YceK/YidQ family lipoprotein [Gammaproteobacteria bacterium]